MHFVRILRLQLCQELLQPGRLAQVAADLHPAGDEGGGGPQLPREQLAEVLRAHAQGRVHLHWGLARATRP